VRARCWPRRESVVWSGAERSRPSIQKIDVRNPSVWRSGRWKRSRSASAVSMARSEYRSCPPRVRCQPHGEVTSLDERAVVRRPVPDMVFRLVRRVHSRLHVAIMLFRPSRWPGLDLDSRRGGTNRTPTPQTDSPRTRSRSVHAKYLTSLPTTAPSDTRHSREGHDRVAVQSGSNLREASSGSRLVRDRHQRDDWRRRAGGSVEVDARLCYLWG
jgi:hypothetical protein